MSVKENSDDCHNCYWRLTADTIQRKLSARDILSISDGPPPPGVGPSIRHRGMATNGVGSLKIKVVEAKDLKCVQNSGKQVDNIILQLKGHIFR